jgi:RNA polymerase sigma-70 factor (ECF subfamily)
MYGFTNAEAADVLDVSLGVLKHLLHDARGTLDRVFEQRCALINKRGVCHQCSELNGFFNPQQNQQAALAQLDLVQATHDGRQNLLDLRLQLARAIHPLDSSGSDLQESIMSVCRAAIAKSQN